MHACVCVYVHVYMSAHANAGVTRLWLVACCKHMRTSILIVGGVNVSFSSL